MGDGTLRIWTISFKFLGIGGSTRCEQTFKVPALAGGLTAAALLEQVQLVWTSMNSLALVRGRGDTCSFRL